MGRNEFIYEDWKKECDIETRTESDGLDKEGKREITISQLEFIKTCTTEIISGQADYKEDIVVYLRTIIETQKSRANLIQNVIDEVFYHGKVD